MKTPAGVDPRIAAIFERGSKTYFNSSVFFPEAVRRDVFALYAFVRVADDYVDVVPQDREGFQAFRAAYQRAVASGQPIGDLVIDGFVELGRRRGFDPAWTEAFLDSMAADLVKSTYDDLGETLRYIYGSAEVIGLYMAAIMGLPPAAYPTAKALGRSMQYINFIRDIAEDNQLGRRYLPLDGSGLDGLRAEDAAAAPDAFRAFMRRQADLYLSWQAEAEGGFRFIPPRSRIPIMAASRMYNWTARTIQRDPFVVFRRKVKPGKPRILASVAACALAVIFRRY
jgi:phytoene synthase